ncbi:hypothetical protein BGZ98_004923, partial [Dissophora globulifera]
MPTATHGNAAPPDPGANPPSRPTYAGLFRGPKTILRTIYSHARYGRLMGTRKPLRVQSDDVMVFDLPSNIPLPEIQQAAIEGLNSALEVCSPRYDSPDDTSINHRLVNIVFTEEDAEVAAKENGLYLRGSHYYPIPTLDAKHVHTRIFVRNIPFSRSRQTDVDHLCRIFGGYGTVAKIEATYHEYDSCAFFQGSAAIHLLSTESDPALFLDREVHDDIWNVTLSVQWDGMVPFCTYCRQEGHFKSKCKKRSALRCSECGAQGHVATRCFSDRNANNNTRPSTDSNEPVPETSSQPEEWMDEDDSFSALPAGQPERSSEPRVESEPAPSFSSPSPSPEPASPSHMLTDISDSQILEALTQEVQASPQSQAADEG